jgi:hypothetical protein
MGRTFVLKPPGAQPLIWAWRGQRESGWLGSPAAGVGAVAAGAVAVLAALRQSRTGFGRTHGREIAGAPANAGARRDGRSASR